MGDKSMPGAGSDWPSHGAGVQRGWGVIYKPAGVLFIHGSYGRVCCLRWPMALKAGWAEASRLGPAELHRRIVHRALGGVDFAIAACSAC